MRQLLYIILLYAYASTAAYAQRISCDYRNVPLSEVLRQLNREQGQWSINFLYDDLEAFRITTQVRNASVPDAVRQILGFYPLRMIVRERDIYVECPERTGRRYVGELRDELGGPVAFANVSLLSPSDSSVISRGVSSEGGTFVIPCDSAPVVLRATYIGYESVCRTVQNEDVGILTMRPTQTVLNGLKVSGSLPLNTIERGHVVWDMPQLLKLFPADDAYEALTRIPGVTDMGEGLQYAGRDVTLVINGKATSLSADAVVERLRQMPAAILAKAEVLPSAPAKYHAQGMVINVRTKDFAGTHQLSGQLRAQYKQTRYAYGQAAGSMIVQHGKLGLDASYDYGYGATYGRVEHDAMHPLGDKRVPYWDRTDRRGDNILHDYRLGMEYAFSANNRLSLAYTGKWQSTAATNRSLGMESAVQKSRLHTYLHNIDAAYNAPFGLALGVSYTDYQNPRTQNLNSQLYEQRRELTATSRQHVAKWVLTADQTHGKTDLWEVNYGVEAQLTRNDSYQNTSDEQGNILTNGTSRADYNERILSAYLGGRRQLGSKLSLEASAEGQHYKATKWNEWRLLPAANATWTIDKRNVLSLDFSNHVTYPTYWATMSSVFYTSGYSEIWGNPELRPYKHYEVNATWQYRQRYTLTAYAMLNPGYSVQLAYQPRDRMAVIMKEVNFSYSNAYGMQANARVSAGRWLNATLNATTIYRHVRATDFFDLPFDRKALTGILSASLWARLSQRHDLRLMLRPSYQTKAIQGIYNIDPLFRLSAQLRWASRGNRWSAVLSGENLTRARVHTHSQMGYQDFHMHIFVPYPSATLSISYRIGNFKEKKTKQVDTSRMGY